MIDYGPASVGDASGENIAEARNGKIVYGIDEGSAVAVGHGVSEISVAGVEIAKDDAVVKLGGIIEQVDGDWRIGRIVVAYDCDLKVVDVEVCCNSFEVGQMRGERVSRRGQLGRNEECYSIYCSGV